MTKLEIQRDPIPVTTYGPEPDKNWRYTDHEGHEHYYDNGYPTLGYESDEYYCVDCLDHHQLCDTLVCLWCDEEIVPATTYPTGARYISGPVRYLVDGEEVSEEEFRSYLE